MRKRSRTVALCIVGAAAFALAGCREEAVESLAVPDLATCKAQASVSDEFSAEDCDTAFAEATALHAQSAPRYDSQEVCEEVHGEGACGTEQASTGSGLGSIFMPMLAGMLIGNMLGGRGLASQPLYRSSTGGYTNATGSASYASNSGKGKLGASQFDRPPSTVGKAPMTKAAVASRGGFGTSGGKVGGVGG